MKEIIEYEQELSVKTQLLNIKSYPAHFHSDFQIMYVLEGELKLKLFYTQYILTPGSIHIIHPSDVHSMETISENNLVLILNFSSEYFCRVFPHFSGTIFITTIEGDSFSKIDVLRDQIFSIVSEDYNREPGFASRLNNIAVSLFNTLMTNFRGFVIDETDKSFVHKTSNDYIQTERVSRIIQYVYENYPYKISLSEIAEMERISPYYLSHIFHKFVGLNFRDFLSMVRVEMSLPLILATKKSIVQISQEAGFSDAKYYVSTFYSYLGCHPKEYRKKNADTVYGIVEPNREELPLDLLKPLIASFTALPVFKDTLASKLSVDIDFKKETVGKIHAFNNLHYLIEEICSAFNTSTNSFSGKDVYKLYKDENPQWSVLKLLENLVSFPLTFVLPTATFLDTADEATGLFTSNGLRKPLFFFYNLVKQLPTGLLSSDSFYIALKDEKSYAIILFNPSKTENTTIEIVAKNLASNCKLVRYKLSSNSSCLSYLTQLNFATTLDHDDYENITAMSKPRVDFEIIPDVKKYYTSVELEPLDVLVLHFKKLL